MPGKFYLPLRRYFETKAAVTLKDFDQADREALHVRYADEALCIGGAPSAESYLNIPRLLAACESGREMIVCMRRTRTGVRAAACSALHTAHCFIPNL